MVGSWGLRPLFVRICRLFISQRMRKLDIDNLWQGLGLWHKAILVGFAGLLTPQLLTIYGTKKW